jgi:branched-chain amino acid transport system substrate-binding protein
MARSYSLGIALAITLLQPVLSPCPARAQAPIKIGWVSSLTGVLAAPAQAENIGVRFAVDEINRSGGIDGRPVVLLTRDTASDPTKAVALIQGLILNDKVSFLIGPVNSGEALAADAIMARAGTPDIALGAVNELTDVHKFPRTFRAINTNTQYIETAVNYTLNTLKRRKIALLGDSSGYGASTLKEALSVLAAEGVTPVYTNLIDFNQVDPSGDMVKARAAGADVVMVWSAATGLLARLLNARGNLGWNVPMVGHPSLMALSIKPLLDKPAYWDNTFSAGYASTTYQKDSVLPVRTRALMDAIRPSLGGGKFEFTFWWVALGYDSVKIIEHAIHAAKSTDPAALQAVLEQTTGLKGAYGTYSWGPDIRNGFPDSDMIMDQANSFDDGCFQAAPQ